MKDMLPMSAARCCAAAAMLLTLQGTFVLAENTAEVLRERGAKVEEKSGQVVSVKWTGASKRNPDGPQIVDEDLALVARLEGLEELYVSSELLSDAAVGHLAGLKNLRVLEIGGGRLTDDWGVGIEGKLPRLEHLRFAGPFSDTGRAYRFAKSFPILKFLNLHHHTKTLGDQALAQLSECRSLERLVMGGNGAATAAGFEHVAKIKSLKDLNLNHCFGINSDEALAPLSSMPNLEKLQVTMISDQGLAHLAGVKSLKTLIIGTPSIVTGEGLEHLTGLPNLEEIILRTATVTDDDCDLLAKMKQLKRLDLICTGVTPAGEAKLKEALPEATIKRSDKFIRYQRADFWQQTVGRFKRHPALDAVRKSYEQERGVPQ